MADVVEIFVASKKGSKPTKALDDFRYLFPKPPLNQQSADWPGLFVNFTSCLFCVKQNFFRTFNISLFKHGCLQRRKRRFEPGNQGEIDRRTSDRFAMDCGRLLSIIERLSLTSIDRNRSVGAAIDRSFSNPHFLGFLVHSRCP